MSTRTFFGGMSPVFGLFIMLGIACFFTNISPAVSQENTNSDILVSETEVLELADKFIRENQDKISFLDSARVGDLKLLSDENNKPTQWRVSILKGNLRLGSFNVLAFRAPNDVLTTWFYGPGDSNKLELGEVDNTKQIIKIEPLDRTKNDPEITFPKVEIKRPQIKVYDDNSTPVDTTIQESSLRLPNLAFYTPPGWEAPVIVSAVPGTHTQDDLLGSTFYVDYAYANYGSVWVYGDIINYLVFGFQTMKDELRQDLGPGFIVIKEDLEFTATATGFGSFWVVLDADKNIHESNEADNRYEIGINVEGGQIQPELIEAFICRDQNDPYGTKRTSFLTTDNQVCCFTEWNTLNCIRDWEAQVTFWGPDNEIHHHLEEFLEYGKDSVWFIVCMNIRGHIAETKPGRWFAMVILESTWCDTKYFTITKLPEKITVTSPNGGEIWQVGMSQAIKWTSLNTSDSVQIEYSTDNGSSWTTIISSTPDDGIHPWTVPNTPSTNCYVQITDVDGYPSGRSDDTFTIENITVACPNGGENWQVGTTQNITWTSTGTSGNVKIELTRNGGATWEILFPATPDDNSQTWTVTGPSSPSCQIRITDEDGSVFDQSDSAFIISAGEGWTVPITINGDGNTFIRTFGAYVNATDGYDQFDSLAAPPGMSYYASFVTTQFPNYLNTDIRAWHHPNETYMDWTLAIINATGKTTTMNWDPNHLFAEGIFTLKGANGSVDMRTQNSITFSGDKVLTIKYRYAPTVLGWAVPLTIMGNGVSYIRTFGGNPNATNEYDSEFDILATPPQPGIDYYVYFEVEELKLGTDFRGWISPFTTDMEWLLKIVNAGGITSTLSWNPADIPAGRDLGAFTLLGSGLNVDMGKQGSAQVSGDADLIIRYPSTTTLSVTYNFPQMGWYLISLPLTPPDNSLSALFPTATAAFAYNSNSDSYNPVTTLEPKKGYWVLIPAVTSSTITGVALTTYTEHYNQGWHLIGSLADLTNFKDPHDNPDGSVIATYGWNPSTSQWYQVYPPGTGVLNGMEGYWLAVAQPCDLTIGGSAQTKSTVADEEDMETFYQQFGPQPPLPPFVADRSLAQSVSTIHLTSRNYPNPFNPETVIEYWLPKAGLTKLYVYNTLGQRIRTLVEAQQSPGLHQAVWDGRNDNREIMSNGLYFYKIITPEFVETKKMLLLK